MTSSNGNSFEQLQTDADNMNPSVPSGYSGNVESWGPDPATDTVQIQVSDYSTALASALISEYGGSSLISVAAAPPDQPTSIVPLDNRDYDTPNWFNGDRILMERDKDTDQKCTDGWVYEGLGDHKNYQETAGHCGGAGAWTNFNTLSLIGDVSYDYWKVAPNVYSWTDLESINCPGCNYAGWTWIGGPTSNSTDIGAAVQPIAWDEFSYQELVATDGATTGEVRDNRVIEYDRCFKGSIFQDGRKRCGLDETVQNDSKTACGKGDSGGPVFQNGAHPPDVSIAGMLVAGGANGFQYCYFMIPSYFLDATNGGYLGRKS